MGDLSIPFFPFGDDFGVGFLSHSFDFAFFISVLLLLAVRAGSSDSIREEAG
jgi:hypothetical protein